MQKRNTIGNRLIASIAFMAFLTISVSVIAIVNWESLDDQIQTMVGKNMPTLRASYQLERNTAGLQAALHQLSSNTDPVMHADLRQDINEKLAQINTSIEQTAQLQYHPAIKSELDTLSSNIKMYSDLLYQRNTHLFVLAQTENNIKWLHQDLIDELTPIRQEVEWQLTRMLPNAIITSTVNEVMTEFSLLQAITVKENELHQLVQEIIRQRKDRDIHNAFYFIGYKTEEVSKMSQNLSHYSSTSSYRQLLQELITLVEPGGVLEDQLVLDNDLRQRITRYQEKIQTQLAYQESLIQSMVEEEDASLNALNDKTREAIIISNFILFGMMIVTLFLSVMLSIYLVGQGIVKRLNMLSQDLYAVANNQHNATIQVTGNDEIGLLGDNLRHFCRQMQEMQQSNALNLINNTQASIITCDLHGNIESVNPSAQTLFDGVDRPTTKSLWELFNAAMQPRLQSLFSENSPLFHQRGCNLTVKQQTQDNNNLYLRLDFRLFQQGTQDKVIITMTDITEQENAARWLEKMVREKTHSLTGRNRQLKAEIEDRKRVEADLRATQDELIQAAKMAIVGQTMTSLAHELNQPLSAISTYVFTAKMALDRQRLEQLPASLDKIENLSSRMGRIIASLKSFSKKQSADSPLKPVNIQDSLLQAMMIVESRAKVQKTTITNQLTLPMQCYADQVQLEQVLVNLLVNSCDAVAGCDQREITIESLHSEAGCCRLAVSDSGHGFAAEIIEKLFIPFTTTKEVGLGLGLSICRSIMNRLDGDIFLASNLDRGAMVVLELKNYDNE
ncbi:ATP-binding protein [Photobacterium aphoticum]|uniref:C4-dicarboxylate transport sensor protein DctB n=1 Tax=Photobacterium aphoticum TaxID=754436 RepID=A0A0J1GIH8_9GAMM|nr:ATP-binding protein [Photobacterium aphoticum]KLU99370.1 histidine kinase [Photobacterium aphoticum]PSU55033.1 PAS domain-containing protein [Photobacterium aphoticum]GHA64031.1 two-component sensor histidine kinase [Photobacterium aphoticum]